MSADQNYKETFMRYIMRRGKIENIMITGKLNSKKAEVDRGRRFC